MAMIFLLLFVIFSLTLGIFLSLSKQFSYSPLELTYASISSLANSNRMIVFLLLNIIVIAVILGRTKPSAGDADGFCSLLLLINEVKDTEEPSNQEYDYHSSDDESDEFHGYDGYEEDNDDDGSYEDDSEDENDDLERRIEEFIAKVNKKWREELLDDELTRMALPAP